MGMMALSYFPTPALSGSGQRVKSVKPLSLSRDYPAPHFIKRIHCTRFFSLCQGLSTDFFTELCYLLHKEENTNYSQCVLYELPIKVESF